MLKIKKRLLIGSGAILIAIAIVICAVIFPLDKPEPDADTKPSFPDWSKIAYYFNNEMKHNEGLGLYAGTINLLANYNISAAHVRFIETNRHLNKDIRAEYVFEIVEWLKVEKEEQLTDTQVSLYSEAYPEKWKSFAELYEINYCQTYEKNSEYIIIFHHDNKMMPHKNPYIPLNNIEKSPEYDLFKKVGITNDTSVSEIINKIKYLVPIAKEYGILWLNYI